MKKVGIIGPSNKFASGISYFTIALANAMSEKFEVNAILLRNLLPKFLFPGSKRVGKKISDYFKMDFTLEFDVKDLTDVEVEIDGVKKKMNKGKITIELKGYLTKDVESKWDVSPMYRFMRDFYNKYIVPNRVENMQDKIIADTKKFLADVKMFLDVVGKKPY